MNETLLEGLTVNDICFPVDLQQRRWLPVAVPVDKRPAGSPLSPGEVIQLELEEDDGRVTWWVGKLDGTYSVNPSRYCAPRLTLRCMSGSAASAQAVQTFLNGDWLLRDDSFLRQIAELAPGEGVNLREEGQVMRDGDLALIWSEMTYFSQGPEARVPWGMWLAIIALSRMAVQLKSNIDACVEAAGIDADLPDPQELPRYTPETGWVSAARWWSPVDGENLET